MTTSANPGPCVPVCSAPLQCDSLANKLTFWADIPGGYEFQPGNVYTLERTNGNSWLFHEIVFFPDICNPTGYSVSVTCRQSGHTYVIDVFVRIVDGDSIYDLTWEKLGIPIFGESLNIQDEIPVIVNTFVAPCSFSSAGSLSISIEG